MKLGKSGNQDIQGNKFAQVDDLRTAKMLSQMLKGDEAIVKDKKSGEYVVYTLENDLSTEDYKSAEVAPNVVAFSDSNSEDSDNPETYIAVQDSQRNKGYQDPISGAPLSTPGVSTSAGENPAISHSREPDIEIDAITSADPGLPEIEGPQPPTPTNLTADSQLQALQQLAVESAVREWQSGVQEEYGVLEDGSRGFTDSSPRIDQYATNAGMRTGGDWCGYFTAFNYNEAGGFDDSNYLASYQKALFFFNYRQYTDASDATNAEYDQLQAQHQSEGSTRQFFVVEGSDPDYFTNRVNRFPNYNLEDNTFDYQSLPIRPGDTALWQRGHVGMVESYDPSSGTLTTIEGNATGTGNDGERAYQSVVRNTYDLSDPEVRQEFTGFGRPALSDFGRESEE